MSTTGPSARRLEADGHELLAVRRGPRSDAHVIVAVHSTVLGPALGGCRLWRYDDLDAAIDDALRLSSAMTLKAAAAQLPLGGGKAVVRPPAGLVLDRSGRERVLLDVAETVELLGGCYITAEDVGTSAQDMALLAAHTRHVVGRPADQGGSGDPGAFTAAGVLAAMRACCRERYGERSLAGHSVAIVGLGHVGAPLARSLAREGARLVLADIDPGRRRLAGELEAQWMEPSSALRSSVDILAPCAMGGVIDARLAQELAAQIVCGSANNQLAEDALAGGLADRGVLYAPDFIANAGGLINVSMELTGYDPDRARDRVEGIEAVMAAILEHARTFATTPLAAAAALAGERIAAARRDPWAPPGVKTSRRSHGRGLGGPPGTSAAGPGEELPARAGSDSGPAPAKRRRASSRA